MLGFWQMINAAVGVGMADAVSHGVMFGLGVVGAYFRWLLWARTVLNRVLISNKPKSSLVELGQSPPHQIISAWAGLWLDIP